MRQLLIANVVVALFNLLLLAVLSKNTLYVSGFSRSVGITLVGDPM